MDDEQILRLLGPAQAQSDRRFLSYAVPRDKLLARLKNLERNFLIINAARGCGKSGLLITLQNHIEHRFPGRNIVIKKFDTDAPVPETVLDYHSSFNYWKNLILGWIVGEIGAQIESSDDPDQVSAATYAESIGRKEVHEILRRLRVDQKPENRVRFDHTLTDEYLSRLVDKAQCRFWILMDEFDDAYVDNERMANKLAGLLKAAKHISSIHPDLLVRITIRPHIMTSLERTVDMVQTMRTEEVEIKWSEEELLQVLENRIDRFEGPSDDQFELTFEKPKIRPKEQKKSQYEKISKYFHPFDGSFDEKKETDFRAICTFSLYRPRWMLEFCQLALGFAEGGRAKVEDFRKALYEFSSNRIIYLAGEHKYHIPDLEKIANLFSSIRKEKFRSSDELKQAIFDNIIRKGVRSNRIKDLTNLEYDPIADDVALEIAQDLYVTEILRAKQQLGRKYRFFTYTDRPSLLSSWNFDRTVSWHIHPTFLRSFHIKETGVYRAGGSLTGFGEKKNAPRHSEISEQKPTELDDDLQG